MPTCFRIVRASRVAWSDFLSNQVMDQPPRGKELDDPFEWSSLSVFDNRPQAEDVTRANLLGRFVAQLDIPDDAPVIVRDDPNLPGHRTVFGGPGILLRYVTRVTRVSGYGRAGV
jgi:hypothetical protein